MILPRRDLLFLLAGLVGAPACRPARPPLRVGVQPWPPYELLALARDVPGREGCAFHLLDYGGPTQVLGAFRNGVIDAAPLTIYEALLLAADAPDVRIVWQMDSSVGADAVVVRQRYPDAASVRGARLGYEATALGAYVVARFLTQSGLRHQDVELVPLPLDEHLPAWRAQSVDAVCTYEPTLSRMLLEGGHIVWDSRSIPGELVDVLVVTRGTLEAQLPCVIDLVRRWDEVRGRWLREPLALAPLLAPRLGLPPEQVPGAFRGLTLAGLDANEAAFFGTHPSLEQSLRHVHDIMLREALVPRAPEPAALLDARVVLGLAAERP